MQNRLKIALVVAVFFGLIAAYGIYNFLSYQQKEADVLRAANQEIVVAAQDIAPGTTLNDEAIKKGVIKTTPWPKSSIPAGAFSSPHQVVGKVNPPARPREVREGRREDQRRACLSRSGCLCALD